MDNLYVHIGCGLKAPSTWINFDASPRVQISGLPLIGIPFRRFRSPFPDNVRYGDITKGLDIPDNSCRAIYASHVIEHLSLTDARKALKNIYNLLQPEGLFRFVVPDLERLARDYLSRQDATACYDFMTHTMLGWETKPKTLAQYLMNWRGNSKHLWMWDYRALCAELSQFDFVEMRRATIGDSGNRNFADVEEEDRWKNCLGIECRKTSNA
ncbi:MAG: methyltransferase domain-containing protein [Gammaproteobacteria bacterium]|nr:methyltransferase domain-containing protein [Gammaproteobacteria bacterium]